MSPPLAEKDTQVADHAVCSHLSHGRSSAAAGPATPIAAIAAATIKVFRIFPNFFWCVGAGLPLSYWSSQPGNSPALKKKY
jgi:hypothetical protein